MNVDQIRAALAKLDSEVLRFFDSLSDSEKTWAIRGIEESLRNSGKSLSRDFITQMDYDEPPVGIDEFITNPYYLGGVDIWPRWQKELLTTFDPRNQINEVIIDGGIGIGKCSRRGTLISTSRGMIPIEDIVDNRMNVEVLTESGYCPISEYHNEGLTSTKKVTTKHGHVFEGRPNHRIRVLRGLDVEWVALEDLVEGDCVLEYPYAFPTNSGFSEGAMEALGWETAEGCWTPDVRYARVSVHEEEYDYVLNLFDFVREELGIEWVHERSRDARSEFSKEFTIKPRPDSVLREGEGQKSGTRTIPPVVFRSSRAGVCAYLRGLFSGDGYSGDSDCSLTTTSEQLARQVRVLLTSLGMYCSVTSKEAAYTDAGTRYVTGRAYTVRVVGTDSQAKFAAQIGHYHDRKQAALIERASRWNRNCDHSFSFRIPETCVAELRKMQPRHKRGEAPDGYEKRKGPSRLLRRLVKQRATRRLLNEVLDAAGTLPDVLCAIARGHLLFDTVETVDDDHAHCYDLSVEDDPSYVSDGFMSHNTFNSMVMMIFKLYQLSCLRDPAGYHGLSKGSPIVFGIYNATLRLTDVGMSTLLGLLDQSPYFKEKFWYKEQYSELHFPKNIKFMIGSAAFHVLGHNLFCLAIDEMNFHMQTKKQKKAKTLEEKGKVHSLVQQTSRRMESRFATSGMIIHISSTKASNSYLEIRKREVANNRNVHVVGGPQWEFQPKSGRRESGLTFRFVVGNKFVKPHCLDGVENLGFGQFRIKKGGNPPRGVRTIDVPVEDFRAFNEDPIGSLRDIAGIPSEAINPFFPRGQPIIEASVEWENDGEAVLPHPFVAGMGARWDCPMKIDLQRPDRIQDYVLREEFLTVRSSRDVPKRMPHSPRYIHVDISRNGDAVGVAMVHPTKAVSRQVRTDTGHYDRRTELTIEVDFALQITPDTDEVDWEKIRDFILWLKEKNFVLRKVTYDSPAGQGEIQYLKKSRIEAGYLTLDRRPEQYYVFKTILNENRITWPKHEVLEDELLALELTDEDKIDHPPGGCFTGDTRIPLLDGTCRRISELDGWEGWVYSARPDGSIVAGWARGRKTKTTKNLIDVILDNGAVARCTPEHLWMLRDGSYKRAKDLVPVRDRLMPITRQFPRNGGYESRDRYLADETGDNHRVRYVIPVTLDEPVPVYDLEVDEWNNFALSVGVFVHNSKDVSDSVCGAVWNCMQDEQVGTLLTPTVDGAMTYQESTLKKVREMIQNREA